MQDILKIMTGVFLGEFVWGVVLFAFLYFLVRGVIRNFKRKITQTGFNVRIWGNGFLGGFHKDVKVDTQRAKAFVRYSGKVVNSTINRMRN